MRRRHLLPALASAFALAAAAPDTKPISPARIKQHVRVLASDAFEGRGPTQAGEAKTVAYLARQMAQAGLRPGGPNGSWYQDVPLVRLDRGAVTMAVTVGGETMQLRPGEEVTASSSAPGHTRLMNAPIVFGGYGVVSDELGWDPYRGADLKDKVVLLLWGDPDVEAGRDLGFGGRATTLSGRLGVKTAAALARGAAAVLVVHEDFPASYPWSQVASSDPAPKFTLDEGRPLVGKPGLGGAMRRDVAVKLLRLARLDFATLKRRAQEKDFRAQAVPGARLSADFQTTAHRVVSRNVIGMVPGTSRAEETVLYGAHWDAYGHNAFDPPADRIRNGAVDNAIGTATLLEIARAFARGPRPQRTVLFAAWTAEEKGLLGANWYAGHPLRPLETTAAVFNLDPHVALDATRNLDLIGGGRTPLEQDLARVAAARRLRITPEVNTEAGWYFRSDHFAFAGKGVPTVYFRAGQDLLEGGFSKGHGLVSSYNSRCYHQTCDEYDRSWTMFAAAQEGSVAYDLGREIANSGRWPTWNAGSEYSRLRDASAASRR
jgi:Zn-dependent M28 family amino/carboxypeptidase